MSGTGEDEAPRKSFKDRIAMFNQPKEAAAAAPPPRAPKPKVFKWKTSSEDSGEPAAGSASSKVATLAEPPPPAPTPTPSGPGSQSTAEEAEPLTATSTVPGPSGASPTATSSEAPASKPTATSQESSGLSASDAKSKSGSLKDRIAALSGLKVDQPGLPGRPPKPWKKKSAEPVTESESSDTTVNAPEASGDGAIQPDTMEIDTEKAQTIAPGTDTPGEPLNDERPPLSRAASSVAETKPAGEDVSSAGTKGAVALPAMPTRARGPQRKARSGNTAPAAEAATSAKERSLEEVAPTAEAAVTPVHYSPDATKDTAPSLADIASPATEPSEFLDESKNEPGTAQEAKGAEALEASTPLEDPSSTSTGSPRGPLPKPPPTAATAADEEDEESEDEEGKVEHETEQAEEQLARQTLDEPTSSSSPASASKFATSPLPPIDTSSRPASDNTLSQSPMSPPLLNRRSMTRPPVPSGFSQTGSGSASPKSSFDAIRPTSSFDGGNRRSMSVQSFRSTSEAGSAAPDDNAGDGEFANPALDAGPKSPIQPPVSRPFDTQVETIASPAKQSSVERVQAKPTRSASSAGSIRTAPSRQGSMASISSAIGQPSAARSRDASESNAPASNDQPAPDQPRQAEQKEEEEAEYEDPEVARRQALAKRMAAMGGMKMGMLPPPMLAPRRKTMPLEDDGSNKASDMQTVTSPLRETAPPLTSPTREQPSSPSPRPSPASRMSHLPPPGAFVLPGLGRPAPPQPVEPSTSEPEAEEEHDEGSERVVSPVEESSGDHTIVADTDEDEGQLPPPPPIPAGARPSRPPPPPVEQVSDEEEEEHDEDANTPTSELQRSMSIKDSASLHSSVHEGLPAEGSSAEVPSSADPDDEAEAAPSAPPSRPSRPPPPLMTSDLGSPGEQQVESPVSSMRSYSQRSIPGTPISAHGRQASLPQMSPVTSSSPDNRRSSMMLPAQGGSYPQTQNSQPMQSAAPGLSHGYLAHLATNAIRTKSREVDGPLANIINDIAYAQRADPNMFGTSVWRTWVTGEKGVAADLQIHGKIEAGCVFLAWDAKFDRGIGRSSLKIGSLQVPHIAIVAEDVKDVKKPKVRVIELLQGRHHEVTYKLDDLKLGSVDIRRLP